MKSTPIPRPVKVDEAETLSAVYRDAVLNLGKTAYSAEQTKVWAEFADDAATFRQVLSDGLTLCIDVDGAAVAFGQLNPDDHIALLYCRSAHAGKGYASTILQALEQHACDRGVNRLTVKASLAAYRFFEHHGYAITDKETVSRSGVSLDRYSMEKMLSSSCSRHTH